VHDHPTNLPPLPALRLEAVLELRDQLVAVVGFGFVGDRLSGATYTAFTDALALFLESRGVRPVVADASARLLRDRELTLPALRTFSWRVAANLAQLQAGVALGPGLVPRYPEWCPVQILSATEMITRSGRAGCAYQVRFLSGTPASATVSKFWLRETLGVLAREAGFTRPRGGLPYAHPAQLVGLRFLGLVTPEESRGGVPGFHIATASSTLVAFNREILRRRYRRDGRLCPFGLNGGEFISCHVCACGYIGKDGVDGCAAATHPRTYESAPCSACGRAEAPFDPAQPQQAVCVNCALKARLTRKDL
jgi:hypothetical protein